MEWGFVCPFTTAIADRFIGYQTVPCPDKCRRIWVRRRICFSESETTVFAH
jgi:hypothetical protein